MLTDAAGGPALWVAARSAGAAPVTSMTLYVAVGKLTPFTAIPMHDDGRHDDGAAGDGRYGVTTAALPAGKTVRFYVEASVAEGHVACLPASAGSRPVLRTTPKDGKAKSDKQR
jgi:hypothetical protein